MLALQESEKIELLGRQPLSYNQESLLLVWDMDRSSAAYNVVFTMRILSEVDPVAMKKALESLQERHAVTNQPSTACISLMLT